MNKLFTIAWLDFEPHVYRISRPINVRGFIRKLKAKDTWIVGCYRNREHARSLIDMVNHMNKEMNLTDVIYK